MQLKNQFIMAPVKLGYSDAGGEVKEKHIRFYLERSKHIGAITVEPLYLDKGLREIPTQLGIDTENKIAGLKKLTDIIHSNGGKVISHLSHPGRMANPKLPGNYYLSSTNQPCENGGAVPKSMNADDMEIVKKLFVDAVIRSEEAGFDMIELQFGHGYLLSQFLSAAVNDRNDEYGGSFQNRIRFPLSILDAVKSSVKLPIIIRISAEEMIPNGIKIEESIELVKKLKQRKVDAVHVSAGTVCSTPPWFFQHMFVPKGKTWEFAFKIKQAVNIPIIFVGRINSPADVDKIRSNYNADYIALGRALVADPDFVGKYLGQTESVIRPCLACSEGCLGGVKSGQGLHCVVNPLAGYDDKPLRPADKKKKYAVIGAGLAGMQAALTLKERGHEVDIYEKDKIGGQFNLAWLPPNKESLKEIIDYFDYELRQKSIQVFYQEATVEDLSSNNYDGILMATGAVPAVPHIKGLMEYFWAEFLEEENLLENQKVVVIGGGLIGIEIASKLVDRKNNVIIVEMLDEVASGMEMIEKTITLKKLNMKNVPVYINTKVEAVDGDKVYLSGDRQVTLENVDKVVVATGMKSYHPLTGQLKDNIPVYLIGDAKKVGKAQDAIRDAFVTAMEL